MRPINIETGYKLHPRSDIYLVLESGKFRSIFIHSTDFCWTM